MNSLVFTWIFILIGAFSSTAWGQQKAPKAPAAPQPLVPILFGSMDCPNLPGMITLGGIFIPGQPLIRPAMVATSPSDVATFKSDLTALVRSIKDRIGVASRARELARFDAVDGSTSALDVIGGRLLPVRDAVLTNEVLMRHYFARWFEIFARNALPSTLDYLEEYAVISHEFGHLLLAVHGKTRSGPNGQPDKFEELRADCVAGYMMGTLLPGGFVDPRRARIAHGFAKVGDSGGQYSHGTWKERSDAATSAFATASVRMGSKTQIVLKSSDIVGHCEQAFPAK